MKWSIPGPIQNYDDPNGPLFRGDYAPDMPEFRGQLKVVCWNMGYAERIETAVNELQNTPELQQPDILLLQEMTEQATELVAETIETNYLNLAQISDSSITSQERSKGSDERSG
jgi:archaellum component FlaC